MLQGSRGIRYVKAWHQAHQAGCPFALLCAYVLAGSCKLQLFLKTLYEVLQKEDENMAFGNSTNLREVFPTLTRSAVPRVLKLLACAFLQPLSSRLEMLHLTKLEANVTAMA